MGEARSRPSRRRPYSPSTRPCRPLRGRQRRATRLPRSSGPLMRRCISGDSAPRVTGLSGGGESRPNPGFRLLLHARNVSRFLPGERFGSKQASSQRLPLQAPREFIGSRRHPSPKAAILVVRPSAVGAEDHARRQVVPAIGADSLSGWARTYDGRRQGGGGRGGRRWRRGPRDVL